MIDLIFENRHLYVFKIKNEVCLKYFKPFRTYLETVQNSELQNSI